MNTATNHTMFPTCEPAAAPASILIVDDMPANIQVLAQILKDRHTILFARSGEEALRVADKSRPDLILLDVMMPGMDGYAVCTALKANPDLRDIPVIFVTAMGEVEDETKGLEIGAIDYITKPVNPAIVRCRVHNHLELKRQRDLLRRIALVDGLTGIANRRRFDEALVTEWQRAQRQKEPLSLILGDVDHFKAYNDHYGHQAGDDCLRSVAQAIAEAVNRPADLVARYGGEEFICILPHTDAAGALTVAEVIRQGLAALALPHEKSSTASHATISLGIAACVPSAAHGAADLIALADAKLYEAKTAGRDRACCGILEPAAANA